MSVVCLQ